MICFGLAREADDHVAGKADIGHSITGAREQPQVVVGGIAAVHGLEDSVGAALRWQVQISADARASRHDVEGLIVEVARVGSDEPEPWQYRDGFVYDPEEIREARGASAVPVQVMIDRLSEQRHLEDAGASERLHLFDDLFRRAVDLGPARERHHAEGAKLVAASGHSHLSLRRPCARHECA